MVGQQLTNDEILRFNHERKLNRQKEQAKTTRKRTKVLNKSESGSGVRADSAKEQ